MRKDGRARWQGKLLFVTDLLVHEAIGFEPFSDRHWILHFAPVELGIVDNARNQLCAHANCTFTRRRVHFEEEA